MGSLREKCRSILAERNLDETSKLARMRVSLRAGSWRSLFSARDRRLARILNDMIFQYSPAALAENPGYYLAAEAIVAAAGEETLAEDPGLTYARLLRYSLNRADLSVERKTRLIEVVNDWLRAIYVANGGTATIPAATWHAFDRLQAFRGTPSVPFSAYQGLVIRALGLAEESLAHPSAAIQELAGYREFMAAIQEQKWALIPLYPALQDFNQGYR